jgi:hypothetical protein
MDITLELGGRSGGSILLGSGHSGITERKKNVAIPQKRGWQTHVYRSLP